MWNRMLRNDHFLCFSTELPEETGRRPDHSAAGAGQADQRPPIGHRGVTWPGGNGQPAKLRSVRTSWQPYATNRIGRFVSYVSSLLWWRNKSCPLCWTATDMVKLTFWVPGVCCAALSSSELYTHIPNEGGHVGQCTSVSLTTDRMLYWESYTQIRTKDMD